MYNKLQCYSGVVFTTTNYYGVKLQTLYAAADEACLLGGSCAAAAACDDLWNAALAERWTECAFAGLDEALWAMV